MGDILFFEKNLPDIQILNKMQKDELEKTLHELENQMALLDEQEPQDMMSEEYELWGDKHEQLEDIMETIIDLLEE